MNTENDNLNLPLNEDGIRDLLKSHGVSPTKQRLEIAAFIFEKHQHLSADNILDGVNHDGHRVSRATVYNTLGLFTSKGLVKEVLVDRERVFYDSNNTSHNHIFNLTNGELKDLDHSEIELINLPELPDGLKVVDTEVIIKVAAE